MERPGVAGVGGGVGASIVAAALGAEDLRSRRAGAVDVLVCRSTAESVERAHRAVADGGGRPVLVVVADGPARAPREVKALIAMVLPHVAAVIEVPFVPSWRREREPRADAEGALSAPTGRHLVPFARAMQRLADTLVSQSPSRARLVPVEEPVHRARSESTDRAHWAEERRARERSSGRRPEAEPVLREELPRRDPWRRDVHEPEYRPFSRSGMEPDRDTAGAATSYDDFGTGSRPRRPGAAAPGARHLNGWEADEPDNRTTLPRPDHDDRWSGS